MIGLFQISGGGGISLINNHFEGFLDYDNLYQEKKSPSIYWNKKYKVGFFHDFDAYHSLASQLPKVMQKYQRRINRFYEVVREPCMMLRYISNEPGENEVDYINCNFDYILATIKKFNPDNHIIFIANKEVTLEVDAEIYKVEKDENEWVAREFLKKNKELYEMLQGVEYCKRNDNQKYYLEKMRNSKKSFCGKIYNKIEKEFRKPYIHEKIIG